MSITRIVTAGVIERENVLAAELVRKSMESLT